MSKGITTSLSPINFATKLLITDILTDKHRLFQNSNEFLISPRKISPPISIVFFDAWQELSASPSDLVLRDSVIQRGELLATNFNNTVNELNTIQSNINDSLLSGITEINSKLDELAALNETIYQIEIRGQTANTARDTRDELAKDLATTLGAESYETSNGMLSVQLPGGLPLVQGNDAMSLEAVTSGSNLDLVLNAGGVSRTLSIDNLGGEFQGMMEMRDEFIPGLMDDLDRLAYENKHPGQLST